MQHNFTSIRVLYLSSPYSWTYDCILFYFYKQKYINQEHKGCSNGPTCIQRTNTWKQERTKSLTYNVKPTTIPQSNLCNFDLASKPESMINFTKNPKNQIQQYIQEHSNNKTQTTTKVPNEPNSRRSNKDIPINTSYSSKTKM